MHSQVLQHVAKRLGIAFQAFSRRVKNGRKPGSPGFSPPSAITHSPIPNQTGRKVSDRTVTLSKLGEVRIKQHRRIDGGLKPAAVTAKKGGLSRIVL